jgi:hypothetical protein
MSDTTLTAEPIFNRNPLNSLAKDTTLNPLSYDETLIKIEDKTFDNTEFQSDNYNDVLNQLELADSSVLTTKLLQTVVTDRTDALVYTLESILFNHWIYLSAKNLYKASLYIELPRENTSLRFTSQQAIGLYFFCTLRYYMPHLELQEILNMKIPNFRVNRVVSLTNKTISSFKDKIESKYLSDKEIQEIIDTKIEAVELLSTPDFRSLCEDIFRSSQIQFSIYAHKENIFSRAYAHFVCANLYVDETVEFNSLVNSDNSKMSYGDLISILGINIEDYTLDNYLELSNNIIAIATSTSEEEQTKLGVVQKAMSSLLMQLSSYSVQIVEEINENPIIVAPSTAVRASNLKVADTLKDYIFSTPVKPMKIRESHAFHKELKDRDFFNVGDLHVGESLYRVIEINVKPNINRYLNATKLGHCDTGMKVNTNQDVDVLFSNLTDQQKLNIFNLDKFNIY